MAKIIVRGGKRLHGEVTIGGAKNSTVALIPAAILADTPVKFDTVPQILDVKNLQLILKAMNVDSSFENGNLDIDPTHITESDLPSGAIKSLRASYYFMGALLGRFSRATVTFPGGDNLGKRPIDQHIKGFEALGAKVTESDDIIHIDATEHGLIGARIALDTVSVGATINIILAAVRAKGQTIIENAAREPEIIDIVTFLNNMGANIRGAGTDTIRISGVPSLKASNTHTVIPDRIEAGTYMSMAAAFGNGVAIKNVIPEHLESYTSKLIEMGVNLDIGEDVIYVYRSDTLNSVNIKTMPYPGFATDLQQPITPLLLMANGESLITDTIYPKRVKHIAELRRMGGDIASDKPGKIKISHSPRLIGTDVEAAEIRAGAALVIAAIMAEGVTVINDADHILRGYDRIQKKLTGLGADISIEGIDLINLMP
ncbi:UDP-N-acetylglucosamine 1-carboxyvinyltransferase [Leuconostoc carnosum]|uniref:UDP-N-acetylglucosamine 1-carboxyvinyltransferase n=2 Tax=Leuconostoc carnosum TaxID=1252 RepID=K0DER1_LEUCJ|nr:MULTISPECIES: UDP-N-acetylglucosamine 1-carboxyvinyltransferase [Leuconostoc]AFT82152.1 UDP-N-acetylglucosamine 1-carboxyvinyltransferase [Leuconostoc carnosum JB16]KAA8324753.1 UDP-N-acetylglucosamine 1-carboxyvinyltransferase [Leuconostoc carnosum]KAA8327681.1 UDP-N-acetylglucosamine 1-carboxyvinyltransferase [Leuconostoc carnosum]KAA8358691.1 UDP-N-acetylglucosamine 1-carboxyvinyltransferase [Leuconostoc carnosum]KAA8364861.1 UDP-N-acetylglucosamine 1-carboxyvinyltransferase [Leuconostoc